MGKETYVKNKETIKQVFAAAESIYGYVPRVKWQVTAVNKLGEKGRERESEREKERERKRQREKQRKREIERERVAPSWLRAAGTF
jgi:hypothetical protein